MTPVQDASTGFTLALTEEERRQLLSWLEQRLRDKLVEEHRTAAADFREYVLHEETILQDLIRKLQG